MTIVERRCPRCAIRRTLWLAEWGAFCCNCRLQWRNPAPTCDGKAPANATTADAFEPAELLRLELYRAAIREGIYTDWPATPPGAPSSTRVTPVDFPPNAE